jgi:hypothetical protein
MKRKRSWQEIVKIGDFSYMNPTKCSVLEDDKDIQVLF